MKLNHHGPQDYQSLLMHQEAVRMCEDNPALITRLLATLARWDMSASTRSKPLRDQWVKILEERDWLRATEITEHGNLLRQASPMATILPEEVRLRIIREVRSLKDPAQR